MATDRLSSQSAEDATLPRGRYYYVPDHILNQLRIMDDFVITAQGISRLEHVLQSATMAERDGRDDEYVICALLHDIGSNLCPNFNHGAFAGAIVKPYVSEANWWMVEHHNVFAGYYHWEGTGRDPNARDNFADSEYFDYTAEFVAKYDDPACDPNFRSEPLDHFEARIREMFGKPPKVEKHPYVVDAELLIAKGYAS